MKTIALHLLDIIQNSLSAGATLIEILIDENLEEQRSTVAINDNGCGIPLAILSRITDPYTTTRTTRKVGLGLSLFRFSADQTGGGLKISSEVGKGTTVTAHFIPTHWDMPPWGDVAGVIILLVHANPEIDFYYHHSTKTGSYSFDTREVKAILENVPLNSPQIRKFLLEMINENLKNINAFNVESSQQNKIQL